MGASVENLPAESIATLVAKEAWLHVEAMDYLAARDALASAGYWPPRAEGDNPEILLPQGAVLSFASNDHDQAKDVLTRAILLFGDAPESVLAQVVLAWVYWFAGEPEEAEAMLKGLESTERRYCVLFSCGMIAKDPQKQLDYYTKAEPLVAAKSPPIQAKFHNQRGMALRALADSKARNTRVKNDKIVREIRERAELEYMAALALAEDAKAPEIAISVLNNLGVLYTSIGKPDDAHKIADRCLRHLKQPAPRGKVFDQRASTLCNQKRFPEAITAAKEAVRLLQQTNRQGWLVEALITLGTALARNGNHDEGQEHLHKAAAICAHVGDKAQSDTAYITMIKELPLSCEASFQLFLKVSDAGKIQAMRALKHRIEAEAIRSALAVYKGSRQKAAQELGLSRQALEKKMEMHFPQFLTKPKRKRKSVLSSPRN